MKYVRLVKLTHLSLENKNHKIYKQAESHNLVSALVVNGTKQNK